MWRTECVTQCVMNWTCDTMCDELWWTERVTWCVVTRSLEMGFHLEFRMELTFKSLCILKMTCWENSNFPNCCHKHRYSAHLAAKDALQGLQGGSAAHSTGCLSRRPRLDSQCPHDGHRCLELQSQGICCHLLASKSAGHAWGTQMYAAKHHTDNNKYICF